MHATLYATLSNPASLLERMNRCAPHAHAAELVDTECFETRSAHELQRGALAGLMHSPSCPEQYLLQPAAPQHLHEYTRSNEYGYLDPT